MTRLKYTILHKSNKIISDEIFCDRDFYTGVIELDFRPFVWLIENSKGQILTKGNASSIRECKQKIKDYLISNGADIDIEKRKYKI